MTTSKIIALIKSYLGLSRSGTVVTLAPPGGTTMIIPGLAPTDAAGGDLSGNYPNPILASIITAGGAVGSATTVPVITWDAKGRLTAVTTATITGTLPSQTGNSGKLLTTNGTVASWVSNISIGGITGTTLSVASNSFSVSANGTVTVSPGGVGNSLSVDLGGNVTAGLANLAIDATDGFFCIPVIDTTGGSAPTGIPTSKTGFAQMVYDKITQNLFIYDGNSMEWRQVATSAVS